MSGFSVGGVVKVLDNDKALRDLQDGHGGYNAEVGKVSHLYCYICCCHDILTATKALCSHDAYSMWTALSRHLLEHWSFIMFLQQHFCMSEALCCNIGDNTMLPRWPLGDPTAFFSSPEPLGSQGELIGWP